MYIQKWGITALNSNLTFTGNTTFYENNATMYLLQWWYWSNLGISKFNGTNTFTGNSAQYGGAIYARTYLGNLVILLAVKCVLGAHFRASSLHMPTTCKLSSSLMVSDRKVQGTEP